MEDLEKEIRPNENNNKTKTFTVPFSIGDIKDNISISTNQPHTQTKEELITKAFQAHSVGNLRKAAKFYKLFIDQGYIDPRVFSNYGIILNISSKLEEAEISTRKAIELKPDFFQAHNNLGLILNKDESKLKEAAKSIVKSGAAAIPIKPLTRAGIFRATLSITQPPIDEPINISGPFVKLLIINSVSSIQSEMP